VGDKLYLSKSLLRSNAFHSLGRTAIIVYLEFRMRCEVRQLKTKPGRADVWEITNNGKLEYTYTDAEKRHITRPRFMRALDELVAKGFIDVTYSGLGIRKDKSTYAISDRWKKWGTKEFIERQRQKDTRQGRGFALYWANKKHKHK
jgi:DNA-binding PadR family transcriptional regulator